MYSKAEKRYKSIKERAFKSFLELYLIKVYLSDKTLKSASIKGFKEFFYDDTDIPRCLKAYQLPTNKSDFEGNPVEKLDSALEDWFKTNPIKEYKEIYNNSKIIDLEGFKATSKWRSRTFAVIYVLSLFPSLSKIL